MQFHQLQIIASFNFKLVKVYIFFEALMTLHRRNKNDACSSMSLSIVLRNNVIHALRKHNRGIQVECGEMSVEFSPTERCYGFE